MLRKQVLIAQLVNNLLTMQETPVQLLGWEDPQAEEIDCKRQNKLQASEVVLPSRKIKRRFLLKFCVDMMTTGPSGLNLSQILI